MIENYPEDIKNIIEAVKNAAQRQGVFVYIYGDLVKSLIVKDIKLLRNTISFIVSYNEDFDTGKFYVGLIKHITINKEIENTDKRYSILSGSYELCFDKIQKFSPDNISPIYNFAAFTIDNLFYNVTKDKIIDPTNKGIRDLQSDPVILNNLKDYNLWECHDILEFSRKSGLFNNIQVSNVDLARLKNVDIFNLKGICQHTDIFVSEALKSIYPGSVFKFICDIFPDGKKWLFGRLLDFSLNRGVAIDEDSNIDNALNDKKFELTNIYSEFLLSDKKGSESIDDKLRRINTTLKLLFDSSKIQIKKPYIDDSEILHEVAFFGEDTGEDILGASGPQMETFASSLPSTKWPYEPIPECVPIQCGQDSQGLQCCCCHVINYLEQVNTSCHDNIALSCNADGTGPSPGETFSASCTYCDDACDMVLAGNCSNLGSQPWWPESAKTSVCSCEWDASNEIWCVTCGGKCRSDVSYQVNTSDCLYNLIIAPSQECCGTSNAIQIAFLIDVSGSMPDLRSDIANAGFDAMLANLGGSVDLELSLYTIGQGTNLSESFYGRWTRVSDWELNIAFFRDKITTLVPAPNAAWGWEADLNTIQDVSSTFNLNKNGFIFIFADECSQLGRDSGGTGPLDCFSISASEALQVNDLYSDVLDALHFNGITLYSYTRFSDERVNLANNTGGKDYFLTTDSVEDFMGDVNLAMFPADCDCADNQSILVSDLPIPKCNQEQYEAGLCSCDVDQDFYISECGITISVHPDEVRMVCCEDINCECAKIVTPTEKCCGPTEDCTPVCINDTKQYTSLRAAIDAVWCDCFNKGIPTCTHCCCPDGTDNLNPEQRPCSQVDDPIPFFNCCPCENLDSCCNCQVSIDDTAGGFNIFDRPSIAQEVEEAWKQCGIAPPVIKPPEPPDVDVPDDEIICTDECRVCRNPSTAVLNNGIGLVAYEDHNSDDESIIKIKQFKTSVKYKLLPNRKFNYGRLENSSSWLTYAKLYYYSDVAIHWIDKDDWIGFRSGPLENQFFQLSDTPYGSDDTGSYISFQATSSTSLTSSFVFTEDAYDVEWYIIDTQDGGLIGDAADASAEGQQYILPSSEDVDKILDLPRHMYNGEFVPVANPSITASYNYESVENSHHVYLTYQALEDERWNIYLRQIRLSEYGTDEIQNIEASNLIPYNEWNTDYMIGKIVHISDLTANGRHYNSTVPESMRGVIFEFYLPDGRPVYNYNWPSGSFTPDDTTSGGFGVSLPKNKIHLQLIHFMVFSRCVGTGTCTTGTSDFTGTPEDYDRMFKDFRVGQEYNFYNSMIDWVSVEDHGSNFDNPEYLLSVLTTPNQTIGVDSFYNTSSERGNCVDDNFPATTCDFQEGIVRLGTNVYGWQTELKWYQYWGAEYPESTNNIDNVLDTDMLCTVDAGVWSSFQKYKGLNVSEPIRISEPKEFAEQTDGTFVTEELGHCTRPNISVNSNNDIFIVYECALNNDVQQIRVSGTATPDTSLPQGVINPTDPDESIGLSARIEDFTYNQIITSSGINQMPSIYIDYNDVVHVVWQSNRDNNWEIYYADSTTEEKFKNKRITNSSGNSYRPRITTEPEGRRYITWHDDRYGHYEIMLSYLSDTRTIPLSQQNAYMSGYRNNSPHYIDYVPLLLENSTAVTKCYNDIWVYFYTNRSLLGDPEFIIKRLDHPYAFIQREVDDPYNPGSLSNQLCLDPSGDTNEFTSVSAPDNISGKFGFSVASNGEYIIIGDPENNTDKTNSGAFHIYDGNVDSTSFGSLIRTVYNPDPGEEEQFGYSVDIDNNGIICVSAPWKAVGTNPYNVGRVFLYSISGTLLATLLDPSPEVLWGEGAKDRFGWKVKLHDYKAIMSAPGRETDDYNDAGSVYVYNADISDVAFGQLIYEIVSPSPYSNEQFGYSFDIVNDKIFIGTKDASTSTDAKNIYIYDLSSGSYLSTGDWGFPGFVPGRGGRSIIKGNSDSILIGSPDIDANSSVRYGKFGEYSAVDTSSGGVINSINNPQVYPLYSENANNDDFGFALSFWGNKRVVSSYNDSTVNSIEGSGTIFIFEAGTTSSTPEQTLTSPSALVNGNFGYSLYSNDEYIVIGAPGEDGGKGRVYLYSPKLILDLKPPVRSNEEITGWTESLLPANFVKNQAYFIKVVAVDDAGISVTMPDQNRSTSCLECSGTTSPFESSACVYQTNIQNTGDENRYYDIRVRFYSDKDRNVLVYEYDSLSNTKDFSVDGGIKGEDEWTSRGLTIASGQTRSIFTYPEISPTSGLVCGIIYYIEVSSFYVSESGSQRRTQPGDFNNEDALTNSDIWVCDCDSARWLETGEEPADNIATLERWISSANSRSDIRITETDFNISNFNPNINIRTNNVGIITYATNREGTDRNVYKSYSSAFAFFPAPYMYSTGSENIKKFNEELARIDIPIDKSSSTETLQIRNINSSIDHYDNLFMAGEQFKDDIETVEFKKNQNRRILVHSGGADPQDLFSTETKIDTDEEVCSPDSIINSAFREENNTSIDINIFSNIVRKFRVNNQYVQYHVNRNGSLVPVVYGCDISFDIVGTQGCVAIRLRNGSGVWSDWMPFDPELGENTISVPWRLGTTSGLKTVSMQVATYAGLSLYSFLDIIADYTKIKFNVNFYRATDNNDSSNSANFTNDKLLSQYNSLPVASVKPIEIIDGNIITYDNEYIFIEIVPSKDYLDQFSSLSDSEKSDPKNGITPMFDFVHQGAADTFDSPTVYSRDTNNREVFRGMIQVNKDDKNSYVDGLALIIPHFKNDCSSGEWHPTLEDESYTKDKYNTISLSKENQTSTSASSDAWSSERDEKGLIEHVPVMRPASDDPYFIFGDPNYRLKQK